MTAGLVGVDFAEGDACEGEVWGSGEVFTLIAAAVVMRQWWVAEQRAMAREDRRDLGDVRDVGVASA